MCLFSYVRVCKSVFIKNPEVQLPALYKHISWVDSAQ